MNIYEQIEEALAEYEAPKNRPTDTEDLSALRDLAPVMARMLLGQRDELTACKDRADYWHRNSLEAAAEIKELRAKLKAAERLAEAAGEQLAYMDACNDKGDLERNMRTALAAYRAIK